MQELPEASPPGSPTGPCHRTPRRFGLAPPTLHTFRKTLHLMASSSIELCKCYLYARRHINIFVITFNQYHSLFQYLTLCQKLFCVKTNITIKEISPKNVYRFFFFSYLFFRVSFSFLNNTCSKQPCLKGKIMCINSSQLQMGIFPVRVSLKLYRLLSDSKLQRTTVFPSKFTVANNLIFIIYSKILFPTIINRQQEKFHIYHLQ